MNRRDWLMLLISYEGAPRGLDPVRLQKGMFLFSQETDVPPAEKYDFRPYSYGPMSRNVYEDLDALVERGLVERVPVEGQSWSRFKPTESGIARGRELVARAMKERPQAARHLYDVKRFVASRTFAALLENVYDRYPDYAVNSIFRRRS
ncbi:MAG TPA: hypothetical protein VFU94_12595 [Conexibacter sp.]|nr:hypothetical protein [Conexibacter sp.]